MSRVCNRVILLAYAAWDAAILFWDEKERHLSRALELTKEAEALFLILKAPWSFKSRKTTKGWK